jgi:AraC-like DNA-binding protein
MHTNYREVHIFRQNGLVFSARDNRKHTTNMRHRTRKQQPPPATLRVGGASEIPTVLKSFGVDPGEVLTEAGIEPGLFDKPGNLITYVARDRLFKHCVARTGCQHFGFLVGQRMDLPSLGLVGLLMKTSPKVGAALHSLVNFLHLHSQGAVTTLRIEDDVAMLAYDALGPGLEATAQTGDGAVAMMLNIMRTLCGREFQPIEASFAHRTPADIDPYRNFFRIPLYFDAEHYALVFSRKWLDVRPPGADEDLQHLLKNQVDALETKQRLEFPDQVRSVLRSALMTGHAAEEQIAALFSMTARTLSRRLTEFDVDFHELVDECRFEIARQMLANTSLSIGEISTSLGYSRASAFIRAFRRWSDCTPTQWRAAQTDST